MPRHLFAAILLLLASSSSASAQVPGLLGYQGRLLRADGTAATGTASATFAIYSIESAGSPLWQETQTLGLSDGYYSTFLGLVSAPSDAVFDGTARWLEVRVGSETLAPRQQIGSVAHALTARSVRGGSADVAALKVGGVTVVDAAGRLAGSARYSAGSGVAIDDSAQTISLQSCGAGQVLVRDATGWTCAASNPGTVTSVAATGPLSVAGGSATPVVSISQAGSGSAGFLSSTDWNAFNAKYGAMTQCGGDLSGALAAPVVARLQSRPLAATAPAAGQVLKWNAVLSQWEPSADLDSGGTVTGVVAVAPLTSQNGATEVELSIAPANASTDGYLASADYARFDAKYGALTQCGGDLDGALASPVVAKIQGIRVDTAVPTATQVLRFDGTRWAPASLAISDVSGLSSGYVDLTGSQSLGGVKTFASAPVFGTPLAVSSGGTGASTAATNAIFAGPVSGGSGAPAFRALGASDIPGLDASIIVSGTLGVSLGGLGVTAAAPHSVLAGPASGSLDGSPAFRALSATDLPDLDVSKLVSGSLGVVRGGTGASSFAANQLLLGSGTGALASAGPGSTGQVLVSGGSAAPSWQTLTASSISDLGSLYLPLAGGTLSGSLDLGMNEARHMRLENAAAPPATCTSGTAGYVYYDTALASFRGCDGSSWRAMSFAETSCPDATVATGFHADGTLACVSAALVLAMSGTRVRDGSTTAGQDADLQETSLAAGAGVVAANWDAVVGATDYRISIGTAAGGSQVLAPRLVGNATSYQTTGLTLACLASYYVNIVPVIGSVDGQSSSSNGVRAVELATWSGTATGLTSGYTAAWPSGPETSFFGEHCFDVVSIASGTTVRVQTFGKAAAVAPGVSPSAPSVTSPQDGWLSIRARRITVAGVVDADGAGYGGGGGGGGGAGGGAGGGGGAEECADSSTGGPGGAGGTGGAGQGGGVGSAASGPWGAGGTASAGTTGGTGGNGTNTTHYAVGGGGGAGGAATAGSAAAAGSGGNGARSAGTNGGTGGTSAGYPGGGGGGGGGDGGAGGGGGAGLGGTAGSAGSGGSGASGGAGSGGGGCSWRAGSAGGTGAAGSGGVNFS